MLDSCLVIWCRSVLNYFKFAPPPFERFLIKIIAPEFSVKVCTSIPGRILLDELFVNPLHTFLVPIVSVLNYLNLCNAA